MDVDDEFGDLYADVEVEATSAINSAPQFSKTQHVTDEIGTQDGDNDRACVSVDIDDDDDDLDIVLNSDHDGIKRGEGFSIANVKSRELDDEDGDNLAVEESVVGNSRSLYKYLRSQSAAHGSDLKGIGCVSAAYWQQLGSKSMGAQTAQRFSLPRARNILDVNIDVFEQKPWKHPGVDITDYFNFGFNEDSWKAYCKQVDEYRHRGPVSSGTPPSEPAQLPEMDMRKGQAIQVEDSIFERQSSMDVRRQLDRDSDAIQITILDPNDTFVAEASNDGHGSEDDVTDHLSFSSASEDESVEEKYVETDINFPEMRNQVVTDETIGTSNDTKDSHLVEESSEEEKIPANRSNLFEDDACNNKQKTYIYENRYHARRLGDYRKHGDRIYNERSNSPVYKNSTHKNFNLKTNHENDDIISRTTYDKRKPSEYRYHADERHFTFLKRLRAFDPYNDECISYSKSEVPSDYYGERLCGYEDWDTERFGATTDRTLFRSSEEDEYYDERRRYNEDNRMYLYSRNIDEIDEFYDTHGESFRSFTYNDRKRDDIEYTRWDFRGSGRNKRRVCSLFSEVDNHLLKRDDVQALVSRSSEESHINSFRWHGDMISEDSFYRRRRSYVGQDFEPFDREEDYMIDIDGHVDMRRKKWHLQPENEWEDEIMFRNSFSFGKVSGNKRYVSEHESDDHVEELIDDPYVVDGSSYVKELKDGQLANRCRYYKQKSYVFNGNKFSKAYGKSRERLPLGSRNLPLVVGKVKSSKKHKKPKRMDLDTSINDEVARAVDEGLDIEEGQILTKEVKVRPMMDKTRARVNGPHNQNGISGVDSNRILEAMAKMEKRRARFNEPVAMTKKGSDTSITLTVVDPVQETGSNKQQRPARKRRWGANK